MKNKTPYETAFTSVHVFKDKYNQFKQMSVPNGMTLQKLVNRCVFLYITDNTFREEIDKFDKLQMSGSSF